MADEFAAPTPTEIRDAILRVTRNGLIARGVVDPNLTKTSDYYVRATAVAQALAPLYANIVIKADQQMADTAEDDDLVRILKIFGLSERPAQGSAGNIVLNISTASTLVALGAQLVDDQGEVFQVTVGGVYANGAAVPIAGISTGKATNHAQGDVLLWSSRPTYSDSKALVGVGGLIGGTDADTNETMRDRLYGLLRSPPAGGNSSQVALWATEASSAVLAAYVYPALDGPATLGVCVVGPLTYDDSLGWNRGVSDAVKNLVASYVAARMPEHARITTQSPLDSLFGSPCIDVDIAIGLALPLSSSGNGAGGGWVDAAPWPALNGTATRVYVSAVTSSLQFTLTSDDPTTTPATAGLVAGVSTVSWFSAASFAAGGAAIVTATVVSTSGSTGALVVTIDKPFSGIAIGDFVMPNATNIEAYAQAFMAGMQSLGPGQWTADAGRLANGRALRRPSASTSNPCDINSTLLRAISDVGDEVLDVAYLYRSSTAQGVPVNTTLSPLVFVPRKFGLFNKIP